MKKLTLLLAALTVASAAYAKEVMPVAEVEAAPMLKVTSVGQYIEIDNESADSNNDGDIGTVMLGNKVGLSYGDDWSFGLMARKGWNADTDEGVGETSSRIDLDAMRHFENYNLGFRWRQEDSKDEYTLRTNYSYNMVSGWADILYGAAENASDYLEVEAVPVAVKVGPVKLGYYIDYVNYKAVSSTSGTDKEKDVKHQVRVSAPVYSNEKLSLGVEYRYQFAHDIELANDGPWQENNRHIVVLGGKYAMTDNLSISSYYQYEFRKYNGHGGASDAADDYYGEFGLGWTYKF